MKKACILLLIIVSLLACKKEPELKTYVLEITKVEVEAGTTTANIRATYSYPAELKSAYLKLSYNSDMSASENYLTTLDGNTLNVELNDLSVATKYYYCFEYNNGVSQASTSVISFITSDYSLPIVNTKEVTSITATTAECGGEVTDDGGATITARGVCWGTSHNPTINNTHTDDDQGLGAFISSITGLETNVTYYVRAYAANSKGTSYGEECSFTTQEGLAAISTNSVTNITATSAISGGNITDDGGFNITARGVCWSTMQNPTTTNNHTSDGSGLGEFSSSITGLETNMTYYVRAYAINIKGTTYGQERSFTTQDGLAIIATSEITNITTTSAVSGGNITDDGGYSVTVRGVCWSTSQNPTINDSHTTNGTGIGQFTSNITELTYNTVYYVRAYATNSQGTSYGDERLFTTNKLPPTVTTNEVSSITATTAVCGGEVTSDGGASITARGVCYSTSQNPTISNNHTTDGYGTGVFLSNLTGLLPNTTYYVKAYATNTEDTTYGEQKTFMTEIDNPTVTTTEVTNVTTNSALCGGNVTSDGGSSVTERGVCWSTNQNPTINDNHTNDGSGIGEFESSLTGLDEYTIYYVRAYAKNNNGVEYGYQKSFRTMMTTPNGAVSGLFSVASNQQVFFSKGNLQYQSNTNTWKFAENQFNYIGENNQYISPDYGGWIDLFGYGTGNNPCNTGTSANPYPYGQNINNTDCDWGVHNAISNGGNQINIWRTLTKSELVYLFVIRPNASGKYSLATVNGIHGVLLLPDDYFIPAGISFVPHANNTSVNQYSESEWSIFESAGAVFFPASGYRLGTSVSDVNNKGYYWSSSTTGSGSTSSFILYFSNSDIVPDYSQGVSDGCSVRLVQNYNP